MREGGACAPTSFLSASGSYSVTRWDLLSTRAGASAGCGVHTIQADSVTGEKLACLAGCAEGWQTVKTLKIYANALGPTGAASVAPALAKMIHLKTLPIDGNSLGPTGAA